MTDDFELLPSLLQKDEGETFEFKRELNLNNRGKFELAKDCSGFANSRGGLIVYGVSERPRLAIGLADPMPRETIIQIVESRTKPPLIVRVESKRLKNGKYLGLIYVPKSGSIHEVFPDRVVYARHGPITERAFPEEIHLLYDERGSPSRTVLEKPRHVIKEDNSVLMFPNDKEAYRVSRKRGHLFQLADCPLFLPDFNVYTPSPQFGRGNAPLAIGFSHAPALTSKDFIDRARRVESLVRSMPWYFSTISWAPRFYWSVSDDGTFAYGCGVNNLQKAIGDGLRGAVALAVCGEFLGSISRSSLLLVINGYCKYAMGQRPLISYTEINLYLSFIPVESDWVRTLLRPFLFGDQKIFHTLAYEPQVLSLRDWRAAAELVQIPKIKGVIRAVKYLPRSDVTEIGGVIADSSWYRREDFVTRPALSEREAPTRTGSPTDPFDYESHSDKICPMEVLDEAPVMLTNPLVSLDEVREGPPDGIDSFDYPEITQLKVPGYGNTIYIISVTAKPSAQQGPFSKRARDAENRRFLKSLGTANSQGVAVNLKSRDRGYAFQDRCLQSAKPSAESGQAYSLVSSSSPTRSFRGILDCLGR